LAGAGVRDSPGTDLRDLISLLAGAAEAAYPGPAVGDCDIPAAVAKLKLGNLTQRAFLSAARGHVEDSVGTSVPYPLGASAPDPSITTNMIVAGLLATRDVVVLRVGVSKSDGSKQGGDTLAGPCRESVAFKALQRYYSSDEPKAREFLDVAVGVLRDIHTVSVHPVCVCVLASCDSLPDGPPSCCLCALGCEGTVTVPTLSPCVQVLFRLHPASVPAPAHPDVSPGTTGSVPEGDVEA